MCNEKLKWVLQSLTTLQSKKNPNCAKFYQFCMGPLIYKQNTSSDNASA